MISSQIVWSSVIFSHCCISTSSLALGWQVFAESEIHQQLSNGFLLNFAPLELLVYNFHDALTLRLWPLSGHNTNCSFSNDQIIDPHVKNAEFTAEINMFMAWCKINVFPCLWQLYRGVWYISVVYIILRQKDMYDGPFQTQCDNLVKLKRFWQILVSTCFITLHYLFANKLNQK